MAGAMDGWTRKEKLYILQGLNNLDFNKMEIKIPTRTRQEIKDAVLNMVNDLADAPRVERVPLSKLLHAVSIGSKDPSQLCLKTQIARLLPNFNYVPPTESVLNVDVKELFQQIANAIEGKPVVAGAAIMEILHVIIEEVIELCGGYISPEFQEFISRINSSAIPMPPSAAEKAHQRSIQGGMPEPAKTNIPPMYTTANTNIRPLYTPQNTNIPPMYTTANTNIPPMYAPPNTNIPPMYAPPNTNIPPPLYAPANTNIPPMYVCNIQPASREFEPIHAPATCHYEPIYAPANYTYNPMYPPPNMMYAAYPSTMGNYNPMYPPPVYNIICTAGKANCVHAPCTSYDTISVNTQGHFESSPVPAHLPRHELPSRPAGSGAYHAEPNRQYGHQE